MVLMGASDSPNEKPQFDDESLIRIFVRVRREDPIKEDASRVKMAVFTKILHNTEYRLPINKLVEDRNIMMKRMIQDVTASSDTVCEELLMLDRVMQIKKKVIAPSTIVYFDSISNLKISYEEYERRYHDFVGAKKSMMVDALQDKYSLLGNTMTHSNKKRRALEA
jgi:hypothetical protein